MLNNMVSPIDHVVMNHQYPTRTNGICGHHPVRLAYQPPANNTFLSEQINHQQLTNNTFLSEQISTSHQPNEQVE
jgi:hypothetical protein